MKLCWSGHTDVVPLAVNDPPAYFQTRKWGEKGRQNITGPQQRLGKVAALGNTKAVCASFSPLLSLGFFEPRRMSGGRFGKLPSVQDEWLSPALSPIPFNLPPLLWGEKQKTVAGFSWSAAFFSSLHPMVRALSLPSSNHFIPSKYFSWRTQSLLVTHF